jgi:hypothetical protein
VDNNRRKTVQSSQPDMNRRSAIQPIHDPKRPIVATDDLLSEIRAGRCKVTIARINPDDLFRYNVAGIGDTLMCAVVPSMDVERGSLYIDTIQGRR